MTHQQK